MNEHRKSDGPVVPLKSPNNAGPPAAEEMEGRGPAKGNPPRQNAPRTQGREGALSALERVRLAAARDRRMKFTALLHHIYDLTTLRTAYLALKREAAAGVDGETWRHYGERRMHDPVPEVGKWLHTVVAGHNRYYGVPMNYPALSVFRFHVVRSWHRALSRRSQNGRVLWDRMRRIANHWLPTPQIHHPYPLRRLGVIT